MHPNPAFRFGSDAAMLDWAVERGFAHIFLATPDGPMVVHAPVVASGPNALRFHIARSNRVAAHLDGAQVLLSIAGADGYVTPNWYRDPAGQVPTWNYVAIEIDGTAREIGDAALVEQLDVLADAHEPRPRPWTRDKMEPQHFNAMLKAIVGFEVTVAAVRGTVKLSQNKPIGDVAGVIAGLQAEGNAALAAAMRA